MKRFRYASELVAMIRGEFPQFGIAVAGYPETHQEATSAEADLENLRRKVDGGGDVVITQLFYDNADYFAFCRRARAAGIQAPIVPGILPVTNYAQVQRITSLCKARLPEKLVGALTAAGEDEEGQFEAGTDYASEQVRELIDAGVPGVHFYVLNRSPATVRILQSLEATGAVNPWVDRPCRGGRWQISRKIGEKTSFLAPLGIFQIFVIIRRQFFVFLPHRG